MAEGVFLRPITRLTGVSRTTSLKLLTDAGQAFSECQDRVLVNLPCRRIQADEHRGVHGASERIGANAISRRWSRENRVACATPERRETIEWPEQEEDAELGGQDKSDVSHALLSHCLHISICGDHRHALGDSFTYAFDFPNTDGDACVSRAGAASSSLHTLDRR